MARPASPQTTSIEPRTSDWRLIVDGAADGAWNMAVDEALLDAYAAGPFVGRPPTLRLYGWSPAALSLGRNQGFRSSHDPSYLRAHAIDLVRRPTGGLAVLHAVERTYAVVGTHDAEPFRGGVLETYRAVSVAIESALRRLGVEVDAVSSTADHDRRAALRGELGPACFAINSPYELRAGGRKLVGSAQLRRGGAFLQHGSLPIVSDARRIAGALGHAFDARASSDLLAEIGRAPRPDEIDAAVCVGFAERHGVRLRRGGLSAPELARATRLRCWKFLSASWTREGRIGERERRWSGISEAS